MSFCISAPLARTSATEDSTGKRRSRRLLSKHDLHVINNELLRLDQHHDADYKLSDIEHLRHVLTTCYNQDLQICYENEQTVINDVLNLNDLNQELCVFRNPKWIYDADGTRRLPPATEKERDLWMEHWIDVYKSRTAAEKRADRFWRTNFPAKRHRFKKQKVRFADGTKTTSAHRVLRKATTRSSTSLHSMGEKLDQAPNDIDNRTISTTSPTSTSRARVGEKKMTSPTSTTTSTSQRQRGQGSTCNLELGKLMGARTNTHSTTSSNSDTAVYTKPGTAELGYQILVEDACMHGARLGQVWPRLPGSSRVAVQQ